MALARFDTCDGGRGMGWGRIWAVAASGGTRAMASKGYRKRFMVALLSLNSPECFKEQMPFPISHPDPRLRCASDHPASVPCSPGSRNNQDLFRVVTAEASACRPGVRWQTR